MSATTVLPRLGGDGVSATRYARRHHMDATPSVRFRDFGTVAFEFGAENVVFGDRTFTEPGVLAFGLEGGSITIEVAGREEELVPGDRVVFLATFPHRFIRFEPDARLFSIHIPLVNFVAWVGTDAAVDRLFSGELLRSRSDHERGAGDISAFKRWCATLHGRDKDLSYAAKLEIEAWASRFIQRVRRSPSSDESEPPPAGIARAMQFVALRFADQISVDDIAESSGWPRDRLMSAFRGICGVTLWEYVIRVRLAEARRLLSTTDLPMDVVRERSGFGSIGRLYEAFRRCHGVTPAAYRRTGGAARQAIVAESIRRATDDVPLNVVHLDEPNADPTEVVDFGLLGNTLRALDGDEDGWAHLDGTVDRPRNQTAAGIFLTLVVAGGGDLDVGGRLVRLESGELNAFWGGIPHRMEHLDPGTVMHGIYVPIAYALSWVGAHPAVNAFFAGEVLQERLDQEALASDVQSFSRWPFELAARSAPVRNAAQLEVQARFHRFVITRGPLGCRQLPRVSTAAGVAVAIRYIARHYVEPITLDQVAGAVGWNRERLTFAFRDVCGVPLREYITQVRLAEARRLLLNTDLPMLTICHRAGFPSIARMYEAFHRAEEMTPGEYRVALRRTVGAAG